MPKKLNVSIILLPTLAYSKSFSTEHNSVIDLVTGFIEYDYTTTLFDKIVIIRIIFVVMFLALIIITILRNKRGREKILISLPFLTH